MIFHVVLQDDGAAVAGKPLSWKRVGDDGLKETGQAVSSVSEPLVITTSIETPGFVRIEVRVQDESGKDILDGNGQPVMFQGGAGVLPEKLQGVPEPADFDAYWKRQREELARVPLEVLEMTPMPETRADVSTWDVKIRCAGGKPVSGYLSKPKGTAPKSLGAQVSFMGYTVASAPRNDDVAGDPSMPMIALSINAHGIENGKDDAFYENLKNTTLKEYAFDKEQNSRPETAYFNGMVFRLLRALEFVKSQPEWDGKALIVRGGSQGGFQALVAAGLDKDVSKCIADKPWCCDLAGPTLGRLAGWRPKYTAALNYFDPINHARRITCDTHLAAGLGDNVCPPSGISVLYNHLQAPKKIEYIQGASHGFNPPGAQEQILSGE